MKKNTNTLVAIMALIGTICTGIFLFFLWKKHVKNGSLIKDYFEEDDDFDFDLDFPDEFEEEALEEIVEEEPVAAVEEEVPATEQVAPKARRGYFPLKFHVNE